MRIEQAKRVDNALLAAVNALLPQLSPSASPQSLAELKDIVESDSTHLLIALDDENICGMLTLVVFPIPTGMRAWIEDVVVTEPSREKGVAQALLDAAVQLSRKLNSKVLYLTSNPAREAANHLYRKLGFEQRETNVYRLVL